MKRNFIRMRYIFLSITCFVFFGYAHDTEIKQEKKFEFVTNNENNVIKIIETKSFDYCVTTNEIYKIDKEWKNAKLIVQENGPLWSILVIDDILNFIVLENQRLKWKKISLKNKKTSEYELKIPVVANKVPQNVEIISNDMAYVFMSDTTYLFNAKKNCVIEKNWNGKFEIWGFSVVNPETKSLYFLVLNKIISIIQIRKSKIVMHSIGNLLFKHGLTYTNTCPYVQNNGEVYFKFCNNCSILKDVTEAELNYLFKVNAFKNECTLSYILLPSKDMILFCISEKFYYYYKIVNSEKNQKIEINAIFRKRNSENWQKVSDEIWPLQPTKENK